MGSFRVFSQRTGRLATLAALTVATLAQGMLPALASADSVTSRSVALSSSSATASNVTYNVNFNTGPNAVGAFVVQFCSNTPLVGQSCTAPTGMNAAGVTTATSGASISTTTTATANKVVVVESTPVAAGGSTVSVALDNITNPTDPGTIYARIVTYSSDANAAEYTAGDTIGADAKDSGSVSIAITNTVGVSGAVLESLSFCTSGATIATDCSGTLTTPTLKLGETDGNGVTALSSTALSSGTIYTQISTNAGGGAVVSLKSNAAACGGLHRSGDAFDASHCYIKPATADFTAGNAFFGVKTGAAITDTGNGALALNGSYNASGYYMGFDTANPTTPTSGVTSTYGDPIFNTNGGFANKLDMPLTFGASIANNTPAGNYSADLSLIATGTF